MPGFSFAASFPSQESLFRGGVDGFFRFGCSGSSEGGEISLDEAVVAVASPARVDISKEVEEGFLFSVVGDSALAVASFGIGPSASADVALN